MADERPPVEREVYDANIRGIAFAAYFCGAVFAIAACTIMAMLIESNAHPLLILLPILAVIAAGIVIGRKAA